MTEIRHITPREAALERENARLLQAVRIQSVTVEAQAEEIGKLKAALKAERDRLREALTTIIEVQRSPIGDLKAFKVIGELARQALGAQ